MRTILALIGVTFVLHAVEEYLTFPAFLYSANRSTRWLPPARLLPHSRDLRTALLLVTLLVVAVVIWAILRPSKASLTLSLLIEAILLVNAGWHMVASAARGGYAPGVITAVLINLPFGVYVLRKAVKERWILPGGMRKLIVIAVALHIVLLGTMLAG